MTEADFLITLPSNSNMDTNPNNEQSNYTVKLAEPLHLEGDWEAALVSVQYTPNWLSFDQVQHIVVAYFKGDVGSSKPAIYRIVPQTVIQFASDGLTEIYNQVRLKSIVIQAVDNTAYVNDAPIKIGRLTVQPRYYDSVEALGNELVKLIKEAFPNDPLNLRYIYDFNLKRGEFVVNGGEILILSESSTVLANLLGHKTTPDSSTKADRYAIFNFGQQEPMLIKVSSLWI